MAAGAKYFLYFIWLVTGSGLLLFVPGSKLRLALVAFLFTQALTWPLGLFVVDMGWIEYPVRLFESVNRTSFTFEYLFYPAVCACFNVCFPGGKPLAGRAWYYIAFCTALTLAELLIAHNTSLIKYLHWNAWLSWLSYLATFYLNRRFCVWFFRLD